MDLFRDPKVDWLGLRRIFMMVSLALVLVGIVALAYRGLNLGVDFTGGTLVFVKFQEEPQLDRVRRSLNEAGLRVEQATRFDERWLNQVQLRMARIDDDQADDLIAETERVVAALRAEFETAEPGRDAFDLNNVSRSVLSGRLLQLDPLGLRAEQSLDEAGRRYDEHAERIVDYRIRQGGLISDMAELQQVNLPGPVVTSLRENSFLGSFTVISVESVGPKVGREMQVRARDAIVFSLLGMLAYIAIRFRPIFGLAGVMALFHDVFITLGFFAITQKEISLNVVAALLTLVGYSINDTIVIFDRVRENTRLMRRADMKSILNTSVNQTLNRTVLTSGMTFLAVLSLYLFGGDVLDGFSFALVVGIIIGSYSTLAIASPIVLWWNNLTERRKARARG
jgi:preprotein translocase subunit SecF